MKKTFIQHCILLVCLCFGTTILQAQNFSEILKAAASDRGSGDLFGWNIAIDGDYAIVGAYRQDTDASGMNVINDAGAAYIYHRDANEQWSEVQKIVASDRADDDRFGFSVTIDGDYAIVGAFRQDTDVSGGNNLTDAGAAYIFQKDGNGVWNEVQKIVNLDRGAGDHFAINVELDGDYAIIGANHQDTDAAGGNNLTDAGAAYIFQKDANGQWNEVQKIVASDRASNDIFGFNVAIDGDYAIVGAYYQDTDAMGGNSLTNAGAAYIYKKDANGQWNQVQKIVASDRYSDDRYGWWIDIDGDYIVVGALRADTDVSNTNVLIDAGAAYIYKEDANGQWNEVQKIVASDRAADDRYGRTVAIDGDYIVVGAYYQDTDAMGGNSLTNAGGAYIYQNDGTGQWNEIQKIVPSDRATDDRFGYSVAVDGPYIFVGAIHQGTDNVGGGFLDDAGAAYMYKVTFPVSTETLLKARTWTVFPNPTTEQLYFDGLILSQNYMIIDVLGRVLQEGTASPQKAISVQALQQGTYFLRLENGEITTFVKK